MTEAEVRRLVRREVESIYAREGCKPPTPHVVLEVIGRLKTLRRWDGLPEEASLPIVLRQVVESITHPAPSAKPSTTSVFIPTDDLVGAHPLKAATRLGAKKTRHLKEIPKP